MTTTKRSILAALFAATVGVQASAPRRAHAAPGVVHYSPYTVDAQQATPILLMAAHQVAAELGASDIRDEGGRVTAVLGDADAIHDRVVVTVQNGALAVDYRTQFGSGKKAETTEVVCKGYSYIRERNFSDAVVRRAAAMTPLASR